MIEKMKFISITGPKSDIDRLVTKYLNKYEIHLENALSELSGVHDLRPFVESNPYKDVFTKSQGMVKKIEDIESIPTKAIGPDEASNIVDTMFEELSVLNNKKKELKDERNHLRDLLQQIEPFRLLNYDLRKILHFKFIKYRFGRISHEYFNKFSNYIYDNVDTVFYECDRDKDYVWGVYFAPSSSIVSVDAIFSSLHFERVMIPDEYEGTPEHAYQTMQKSLEQIDHQIKNLYDDIKVKYNTKAVDIVSAYNTLKDFGENFDIRKMAALTQERHNVETFYILCGWMGESDAKDFLEATDHDDKVLVITDMGQTEVTTAPPTKLKNPKLFRPFELFVKMYGMPAYNEFDPTIFVAITYAFIFGIMFGDVGQGLCLVVGGFLLYKYKKMDLAAILSLAGIFSTFFGFMFGSIFGLEHAIPALWMHPMENVMSTLLISVAFGVGVILFVMILNIINAIRAKDWGRLIFDHNGIAGLVFYGAVIACVLAVVSGYTLPGTIILVILLGLPLVAMFLKEPLSALLEGESHLIHGSTAMFIVESLVEMFDILLSFATNTISFLRVGAFALSHAGMMNVVLLLSGAEQGGSTNLLIFIFGNILVAGMEGLVVGIQVLRLEYYEMFGRFYRGTGKEFKPFKKAHNN